MSRIEVKNGERFGRLVILEEIEPKDRLCGGKERRVKCVCDCGKIITTRLSSVRNRYSISCGCMSTLNIKKTKERNTIHGMARTSEYRVWINIKSRCTNHKHPQWKDYGGRGIKMCDRWLSSFENFYTDMGKRLNNKLSIDRINNDGNYELKNCRWATSKEQANNKRINILFNGETSKEASYRLGGNPSLVKIRIYQGWSIEKAFTTPIRRK